MLLNALPVSSREALDAPRPLTSPNQPDATRDRPTEPLAHRANTPPDSTNPIRPVTFPHRTPKAPSAHDALSQIPQISPNPRTWTRPPKFQTLKSPLIASNFLPLSSSQAQPSQTSTVVSMPLRTEPATRHCVSASHQIFGRKESNPSGDMYRSRSHGLGAHLWSDSARWCHKVPSRRARRSRARSLRDEPRGPYVLLP